MEKNTVNILVVAEETEMRRTLKNAIHLSGFPVSTIMMENTVFALRECMLQDFDCIFLDRKLPGNSFIRFIDQLFDIDTKAPVCVIIESDTEELKEEAFFHGALDALAKDSMSIHSVSSCIRHSLEYRAKDPSNI